MVVADGTGRFAGSRGTRTGVNPRREGTNLMLDLTYRLRR